MAQWGWSKGQCQGLLARTWHHHCSNFKINQRLSCPINSTEETARGHHHSIEINVRLNITSILVRFNLNRSQQDSIRIISSIQLPNLKVNLRRLYTDSSNSQTRCTDSRNSLRAHLWD